MILSAADSPPVSYTHLNNLRNPTIRYPAANPATNAPRNPELPALASAPPTKPTARPGPVSYTHLMGTGEIQ